MAVAHAVRDSAAGIKRVYSTRKLHAQCDGYRFQSTDGCTGWSRSPNDIGWMPCDRIDPRRGVGGAERCVYDRPGRRGTGLPPTLPRADRSQQQGPHPRSIDPLAGLHAWRRGSLSRDQPDPDSAFELTSRGNTVAIVTDGSDLFGREGGPPEAALPMLESKSVLFKTFAGIDAFPICLAVHDPFEIVNTVEALTPTFGAICLDDISAPRSFTIADHLEKASTIPCLLQSAPRHGDPRPRRVDERAEADESQAVGHQRRDRRSRNLRRRRRPAAAPGRRAEAGRLRPRRSDLQRAAGADELGEVVPRQGDEQRAATRLAGGDAQGRRCLHRTLQRGHRHARDDREDGARPDRLRARGSGAGGVARRRQAGRSAGRRDRALGQSQHDGHFARLPGRLPRSARQRRAQHAAAHAGLRR